MSIEVIVSDTSAGASAVGGEVLAGYSHFV